MFCPLGINTLYFTELFLITLIAGVEERFGDSNLQKNWMSPPSAARSMKISLYSR